jgi:prepilin peptidase CpaA
MALVATLLAILTAAAWFDVRSFRVPNFLTFPGVVLGIALNTTLPGGLGFTSSLYGFGLGLIGLLPLYVLRVWGAGDVKLMAVVGAFLGPVGLVGSALATFVAGGFTSLIAAGRRGTLPLLRSNVMRMAYQIFFDLQLRSAAPVDAPAQSAGKVAYALAILLGTSGWLVYQRLS